MDNLLLLSVLVATVAVPTLAARIRDARRALAWTLILLAACCVAYGLLVARTYAVHFVPEPLTP